LTINSKQSPLIQWEEDENGIRQTIEITNEIIKIIGNKAQLNYNPSEYHGVTISDITIDSELIEFVRIKLSEEITEINQFKVNFNNGIIYFHPDLDGHSLTVSNYNSEGRILYHASRIYYRDSDDIVHTLEEFLTDVKFGLTILGSYDTLSALQSAHPTGELGQYYAVGTTLMKDVYAWSEDIDDWDNIGTLQGATGADGKSAYQVWLDAGNTGTVTDYLNSLKGDVGDTGATGATGASGTDGTNGKGYNPLGAWVTATAYVNNSTQIDVVSYTDGNSYYCKLSHTSSGSILPTNTTYWGLLAQKGADGAGSGDMSKSLYSTNAKSATGYVDKAILSDTATAFATARTINGVSFDGTANITVFDSTKLSTTLKGAINGLAELDATGKVPSTQLPSFVDDVVEYVLKSNLPATGESGKIYVVYGDTTTNNGSYRWSGSAYVLINNPLDYATQSNAETGTENTKVMTALRVFQAIAKWITTTAIGTLGTLTNSTITATDSIKSALEKIQGQINGLSVNKDNAVVSFVDDTSSRTLALTDAYKKLRATHASTAINYTVPPNSSVAFPLGTWIIIEMTGAAQVAVVAGAGVTINPSTKLKVNGQYTSAVLTKEATDTWSWQGSVKA
jgi:hypothetical protein